MQKFDLAVLQREPSLGAVGILSPNEMLMRSPVVSLQDAAALTCFRSVSRGMRLRQQVQIFQFFNIRNIYCIYMAFFLGGGFTIFT